uniref:Uncharacterized protein n=1 Tax=Aegilops tauschii subsp. strangulata TaxID=200361 RepID=A0A453CDZ2_AEGTS
MAIWNGLTALFWEDRWLSGQSVRELALLLYHCIPKQRRNSRTVAEGSIACRSRHQIRSPLSRHGVC